MYKYIKNLLRWKFIIGVQKDRYKWIYRDRQIEIQIDNYRQIGRYKWIDGDKQIERQKDIYRQIDRQKDIYKYTVIVYR